MDLHKDNSLFIDVLEEVSIAQGIRQEFVEKDYWVTVVLKNLSQSEYVDSVVFKGGTSLSKAYKIIQRFSEDVDLAVITSGLSGNQVKKRIKDISKKITGGLTEIYDPDITSKGSKIRKTLHAYKKAVETKNFGQASDKLLLEINSFACSQPYSLKEISSFIADDLKEKAPDIIKKFNLEPFKVNVLGLERTYAEKVCSLVRAGYSENPIHTLGEKIRHIYDLHMLSKQRNLAQFHNSNAFFELIKLVRADDSLNTEFRGGWLNKPMSDSQLFHHGDTWDKITGVYRNVFSSLIYGELPEEYDIKKTIANISESLMQFDTMTNVKNPDC